MHALRRGAYSILDTTRATGLPRRPTPTRLHRLQAPAKPSSRVASMTTQRAPLSPAPGDRGENGVKRARTTIDADADADAELDFSVDSDADVKQGARSPASTFEALVASQATTSSTSSTTRSSKSSSATSIATSDAMASTNAIPVQSEPRLLVSLDAEFPHAKAPTRGSAHAAGYDLYAAEDVVLPKGPGRKVVPTGIRLAIPAGCYGRVAPRSGLASKHGIDVGAGVIDADYRGLLGVLLFNLGESDFTIRTGDRIAQLVVERIATPEVEVVASLDETIRGSGGFGSTGGFGKQQ